MLPPPRWPCGRSSARAEAPAPAESDLVQAEHRVHEGERRVARLAAIAEALARDGRPHAASQARMMVPALERDLACAREHLRLAREGQGRGE